MFIFDHWVMLRACLFLFVYVHIYFNYKAFLYVDRVWQKKDPDYIVDTKKYPEFWEISPGQGLRCMGVFYHPTLIVRSIFIRHCSHEGRRKDLAG